MIPPYKKGDVVQYNKKFHIMTDQNNKQIKPRFSRGDVVQDIRNTDCPYSPSMIVLDSIIKEYGLVFCVLLRGDKKFAMREEWLTFVK